MKKLTWYHELGFYNNPFSIKPGAFTNDTFGYNKITDEINSKINDFSIILVHGEFGTGKTTILKGIIENFKGNKEVIYFNCNQKDKSIDFDSLLKGTSFLRRFFGIRKRNMIMLLDEAQDLNRKDILEVKRYYDNGFFKSVVFVSKKEEIRLKEIEDLVGKNTFKIGSITKKDAVELVRERIGNIKFIADDMIAKIFIKNMNPRAFLKNCEDVFRHAYEKGKGSVTEKDIKAVLG